MVHYSSGEAVWFSARTLSFTNAASQWLYVNLICRFLSALVGFLRALRLPPTLKNRNPSIFPVSRCVYKACLAASGLITYVCAAAVTQRRLWEPSELEVAHYKTLQIIILLLLTFSFLKPVD